MNRFIPALHGLRGIAALSVLLFHWSTQFPALTLVMSKTGVDGAPYINLALPIGFGWLGVLLFFVLSGYLLGSQLAYGPIKLGRLLRFWGRRGLRIYPAVWFQLLVLEVLGSTWLPKLTWDQWLHHVFLWLNMPPSMTPPLNGVYWTLPIELSFYLTLPLLITLQRRIGGLSTYIFSIAITLAWRTAVMVHFKYENLANHLPALDAFPGALAVFAAGLAVSNLHLKLTPLQRVIALCGVVAAFLTMQVWLLSNLQTYWTGHWILVVWNPLMGLVISLGVYLLIEPPPCFSFLSGRLSVWLGNLSYGLYLWHLPIMLALEHEWPQHWQTPSGSAMALLLSLMLTILSATVSFYLIERPLMRRWRD